MTSTINGETTDVPLTRVVVFAKAPQPGLAKTRLIPALGAQGAAALARQMLSHTLAQALASGIGRVELCMSPSPDDSLWADLIIPAPVERSAQGEGDLGQRMARAVERVTTAQRHAVLLVGTDCPALSAAHLRNAAKKLNHHDAVMLEASDGGYVLLGLNAPCPAVFDNMPWSTAAVAGLTRERLGTQGRTLWQGPVLHDIDEPEDLIHLPAHIKAHCDFLET